MKTVANKFWRCLWVLSLLCMPATVRAETLKVAFAHWPPWKIIEDGRIEGIDADIVRTIAKRLGVSMEFKVCPWPRCIEMVKNGDADLITSFGRTAAWEAFVHYLGPAYIVEQIVFYVRKDQAVTVGKYGDLLDRKIGTIKESSYFPEFDNDRRLDKTPLNVESQLFQMLASGRIELFIGFETVIDYLLLVEGFEGRFTKAAYKMPSTGSHIAISKRSGALQRRVEISKLVRQLVAMGEIDRIIDVFLKDVASRTP